MTSPRRSGRPVDRVEPGYYRYRLVRGGPWLPAAVDVQDGMILLADRDGVVSFAITTAAYADMIADEISAGNAFQHPLLRVVWFGERIDEITYRHLLAMKAWAHQHAPQHPAANPGKPIDLNKVPIDLIF